MTLVCDDPALLYPADAPRHTTASEAYLCHIGLGSKSPSPRSGLISALLRNRHLLIQTETAAPSRTPARSPCNLARRAADPQACSPTAAASERRAAT